MPAGTITALRAQANDPQRVNVFVDGSFALGVSLNTISTERLYVGKAISTEEFERLAQTEGADKATQAALRFLEARPRSAAELRERLRRKEFAPEQIEGAVTRLQQLGLIDDNAFARFWVEQRQNSKPRGPGALRQELRRKGIDRDVTASVLDDDALVGDSDAHVLALARGALHKYQSAPDRQTFSRRMGGFLQRRGFSFDAIRPVLDQLWNELHGDDASDDE